MFSFGIKDIIDILIVALLLYTLYKMMKESGTISIFTGVLAFVGVWIVVTQILDMRLIGSIMDKFMSVGLLILVILFQDEIKRFLIQLGSHKRWRFFFNFFLIDLNPLPIRKQCRGYVPSCAISRAGQYR